MSGAAGNGEEIPGQVEEMATPSPVLDLDAVETDKSVTIKIGDTTYVVRSNLDIPLEEIEESIRIQQEMSGKPWHEQLSMARRQVKILIPELPAAVVNKMTGRQIIRVMVTMMGMFPTATAIPTE